MKLIDLSGQKFGLLTVLYRVSNYKGRAKWLCKCECGKSVEVFGYNLTRGNSTSCGCLRKINQFKKHGLYNSRLYNAYIHIKQRCYNPKDKAYKNYGERGIVMCEEWLNDFMNFYNWSMSNGYKYNLSIDRIDNAGNYEPSNCRWADYKTQNRNTRRNINHTIDGETHCLKEWCEILNLNYKTVHARIYRHKWSIERALNTPIRSHS